MLLGNKSDCPKKINSEVFIVYKLQKIKNLINQHNFKSAEVSAKTSDHIFESIRDFGLVVAK